MATGSAQLRIFISYRRADTQAAARQLAQAVQARFGEDNVFFDTDSLGIGTTWPAEISGRVNSADVVLAMIGRNWVAIADDRGRRQVLDPGEEDVLRVEIESALKGTPRVVPVLVDDAEMPSRDSLPRPFRPLSRLQARTLRHASWDRDVEELVASLERLAGEPAPPPPALALGSGHPAADDAATADGPMVEHYRKVARYLARGTVVPVVGPGANAGDSGVPWEEGCGWLPGGDELAGFLARRFALEVQAHDLARVSQHIFLTEGEPDLYGALRDVLIKAKSQPGPVHRFLAGLPAWLRHEGEEYYPLIVTTNYDTALEQAFDAVHEPFDLVVFNAKAESNKPLFLHVPWWDQDNGERGPVEPGYITPPNRYAHLPIDDEWNLRRSVIVKVHGGPVHDAPRDYRLKDNYVVTEDDYIRYLSQSPIEELFPMQLLDKLRASHQLFLGYDMAHWSLRVFLLRIWAGQHLDSKSWAVQRSLDGLQREFWEKFDVERITMPLSQYVGELSAELGRRSEAAVGI